MTLVSKFTKKLGLVYLNQYYETLLMNELTERGLAVKKQVPVPLVYNEISMDIAFRMDMIAEKKVIIEVKSVDEFLSRC